MKWLSIKKYEPQANVEYFLRCSGDDGSWHIIVGFYDGTWQTEEGDEIFDVTHFCIPDPVEIEEDE